MSQPDGLLTEVGALIESLHDLPDVIRWSDHVWNAFDQVAEGIVTGTIDHDEARRALGDPLYSVRTILDSDPNAQLDYHILHVVSPDSAALDDFYTPGIVAGALLSAAGEGKWHPTDNELQRYRRDVADGERWQAEQLLIMQASDDE